MRVMQIVKMPNETFNAAVREGDAGAKINAILEVTKPQAVYFTEMDGMRTVVLIVELDSPSGIPALSEPWFLNFDANVELHIVMGREDLQASGLEHLGKKWAP